MGETQPEWIEGLVDGLRIDHPDGLADPRGYLARLAKECRKDTPIWTEKILEGDEELPTDWPSAGTTGYDYATMTMPVSAASWR